MKPAFDSLKRIYRRPWGFYWSVHEFVTIDVLSREVFQFIFCEKGAEAPLILVGTCIPPVWNHFWLQGWPRAPAAKFWLLRCECSTVGTSCSQTSKAAEFQCLIWLPRRSSQVLQIQAQHKPARCQSRNRNITTVSVGSPNPHSWATA